MRRFAQIFFGIGLFGLALGAAGHWLLAWPKGAVHAWLGIGAGYLLCALGMLLVPRWWRQHCDDMYAQPAGRRYIRALWPALIGYSLALFLSLWLLRRGIDPLPLRALVAVLPVLPLALMLRAALRYLREIDELQRRIETESIGIASLTLSLIYFGAGLLQKAKVFDVDAGVAMIWVFPLLCGIYGVAKMVLTRRYL